MLKAFCVLGIVYLIGAGIAGCIGVLALIFYAIIFIIEHFIEWQENRERLNGKK